MKKLLFLCFAVIIFFQPHTFCTESYPYKPPIPEPKISIEKAIEIFKESLKKDFPGEKADLIKDKIIFSIEYLSYKDIKNKYSVNTLTMEEYSEDGRWEWIITFSNIKWPDDYQVIMVTQEGKVCGIQFCCL